MALEKQQQIFCEYHLQNSIIETTKEMKNRPKTIEVRYSKLSKYRAFCITQN